MMKTHKNWLSVALAALLVIAFSPAEAQGPPAGPSTVPASPIGVPVEVSGCLYGTVTKGGTSGYGAIWKYNESSGVFSILYSFDGTNGATPYSKLTYGSDGYLYGTTEYGGNRPPGAPVPNCYGGVFRIQPSGAGFAFYPIPYVYYNPTLIGPSPLMGLVEDPVGASGNQRVFYGTTNLGGTSSTSATNGTGTIYEFVVNGSTGTFTKLYDFPSLNSSNVNTVGANPMCELVLQTTTTGRYLFGTAPVGGPSSSGTVFRYGWTGTGSIASPSTGSVSLVQGFGGSSGGFSPTGSLTLTSSPSGSTLGTMWGTFLSDETSGLHSGGGGVFDIVNGTYSVSSLIQDPEMQYPTQSIQSGVQAQTGLDTQGQVCLASDGYLYVTSYHGGYYYYPPNPPGSYYNFQAGSIYRIDSGGNRQLVWAFRPEIETTLGSNPATGVIEASDGYLYG